MAGILLAVLPLELSFSKRRSWICRCQETGSDHEDDGCSGNERGAVTQR